MKCPRCDKEILMAAIENPRNGKWTGVPLDEAPHSELGQFEVMEEVLGVHEAFGILGNSLGILPVAIYLAEPTIEAGYSAHPPSHYLEAHDHEEML